MTAALFDVKAKFSEYVTMAENGDVVEITKHGKTSVVIISAVEYEKLKRSYRPSFVEKLDEWRRKTGGLSQEEYDDFSDGLSRNKELCGAGVSLF